MNSGRLEKSENGWENGPQSFSNFDMDVSTTMVRLRKIEAGDKTKIEMRGVKEVVSGCKESAERMFHWSIEWNWEP